MSGNEVKAENETNLEGSEELAEHICRSIKADWERS